MSTEHVRWVGRAWRRRKWKGCLLQAAGYEIRHEEGCVCVSGDAGVRHGLVAANIIGEAVQVLRAAGLREGVGREDQLGCAA